MEKKEAKHQTFEQGSIQALEIAIATLVRVLPEPSKQAFITSYLQNVSMWDDLALPSTAISDEWLSGVRETSEGLLRLVQQP
ncbi:hypothetical protein ACFIQF_13110 [Comamonas sp. J-3]|uniref:hypothetical protein n=1 Tax=Comamonas trifloxystrobinivorans TaxID=3350256 RepID=UPI003728C7E3